MKRTISILLAVLMALSVMPAMTAFAVSINGFELSKKSDGTYEVTGYSGDNAGLNIPEAYNDVLITSIGEAAFNGFSTPYYNQVVVPKSIKTIGSAAFLFADSLNNVVLNEGLESIGDNAFESCKLLTNINLPSTLKTLGNDVFADDVMLSKITVNEGGAYFSSDGTVLYNADKTKLVKYPSAASGNSYTVPYTVSEISDSAFTQTRYLKSLTIPLSVTKIGAKAFSNDNAEYTYSITDIYFLGTEEEWNKITKGSGNTMLSSVTVHYTPCVEHSWKDVEVKKEASCTEDGEKDVVCTVCGKTETQVIPALGHDLSEWKTVREATKSADGERRRTCSRCDYYESEVIEALGINITVKGSEYGTVTGDFTVDSEDVTKNYKFGNPYSFTAEAKPGYKFEGWKIGGKQASVDSTYSSKAYADITIEAIYSKDDVDTFTVRFYDLYKNIVSEQLVGSASDIVEPTASQMARSGFVFKGWNKDISAIKGVSEVTGVYEPDTENGYTVTVEGADNSIIDGAKATEKSGIPYDSKVTVSAKGVKGWKIGDTVVSTSEEYTFYVGSDVTVTAVFSDVETVPAITIVNVKPIAGSDYKYQFIATRVVPEGYKVEKVGFVYGKNLTEAELTLEKVGAKGSRDNAGTIKAGYNNFTDGVLETSLSYGLKNKDGDIKAKAFMVVSGDGKESVLYSDTEIIEY